MEVCLDIQRVLLVFYNVASIGLEDYRLFRNMKKKISHSCFIGILNVYHIFYQGAWEKEESLEVSYTR